MKTKPMLVLLSAALLAAGSPQAQENAMEKETTFRQIFPQGGKLPEQFAQYFIGQAYLCPITDNDTLGMHVSNVTFEPGCRNNWHSHRGGQLLLVTAGRGFYQEQGQPARALRPGDVVEIAPDVVHWHGAAPDSRFAHLAVECNPADNANTWLGPVDDAQYAAATAGFRTPTPSEEDDCPALNWLETDAGLSRTDPELAALFGAFAFGETQRCGALDDRTRILVTMAAAIATGSADLYRATLRGALTAGVTPVEIRETLYQAVPYAGMGRVLEFIGPMNACFTEHGIALPLEPQAATDHTTRRERGLALQRELFGERIDAGYRNAPASQLHIQHFLSANCFGDYVTRKGLEVRMRELLTFSMLVSLGGCESQVKGHIAGNAAAGNDKATLLAVLTQLLPYIGYPRTLNGLTCLNETIPEND